MDDGTHIWFVDAHTKGDGRHQDRHIVTGEALLVLIPLLSIQAGVIGQSIDTVTSQDRTQLIDALAALAINNDRGTILLAQQLQKLTVRAFMFCSHLVIDIGPVKTRDMDMRIAEPELGQDICAYALGRSGCQRQHWHFWVALAQSAQLAVFRAEIMPPLADTVRFIDC